MPSKHCSRIRSVLAAAAKACARYVLPVPGGPSIRIGFCILIASQMIWTSTGSVAYPASRSPPATSFGVANIERRIGRDALRTNGRFARVRIRIVLRRSGAFNATQCYASQSRHPTSNHAGQSGHRTAEKQIDIPQKNALDSVAIPQLRDCEDIRRDLDRKPIATEDLAVEFGVAIR